MEHLWWLLLNFETWDAVFNLPHLTAYINKQQINIDKKNLTNIRRNLWKTIYFRKVINKKISKTNPMIFSLKSPESKETQKCGHRKCYNVHNWDQSLNVITTIQNRMKTKTGLQPKKMPKIHVKSEEIFVRQQARLKVATAQKMKFSIKNLFCKCDQFGHIC